MALRCLFASSPSYLLRVCVFWVLAVDGKRPRGRSKMSLQNISTSTAGQDVGLFGGLGFEDPLKPASNGLGFGPVVVPDRSNPSCQERSSCPDQDTAAPRSPGDIVLRNCFCDDVCQSYDDCCHDHARHLLHATVETVHLQPEVIGCRPLGVKFKDRGFLNRLVTGKWRFTVVNRCPRDYNEPFIAAKCEAGNDLLSELFYRVPVNGRSSKVLYLNYYCAICNGAREVIFWTGHLDACELPNGGKDEDVRSRINAAIYTTELVRNNSDCELTFDFPDGYVPRPCKDVTRRCSDGWTGSAETVRECQDRSRITSFQYQLPKGPVYRNRHCAVCNHVNETDITCADPEVHPPHSPLYPIPPYSVLVDLNSKTLVQESDGVVVNRTRVELRQCDLGSVYDPFAAVCRPVYCRKDYVLTDSGCVPSNADVVRSFGSGPKDSTTRHQDAEQLDCDQRINLNQSEYRIFENQTLYVYHLNAWYDKGGYIVAATNTSVDICSPFGGSREYNVTVYEQVVMFQFDQTQGFLSVIGTVVSLASLLVLFAVYMALPVMRNTPGKCVVCLITSLFLGQLCYLFVGFFRSPVCFYQAAAMHFGYLAAFFWTSVLAFDICRAFMSTTATTITESGSHSRRFVFFSLYAWTAPAAIVAVCIALDVMELDESFRPHYGELACWISSKTSLLVFFVVPVGVILIVNVVFFVMAVYCICRASMAAESATPGSHKKGQLLVYIKLSLIMGLTWVFGLLATLSKWIVLWYAFICLNSLQGAFLALVFICTKKVYRQMKVKWSTNSSSNSTSSNTEKSNRKRISAINEVPLKKEKSRIISKETCM